MARMATDDQGRPLPENTYYYTKAGVYRYKRADGKFRVIKDDHGKPASYELACQIADVLNQHRESPIASIKSIGHWVEHFITWTEGHDSSFIGKRSWKERKSYLRAFADSFSHVQLPDATLNDFRSWWDGLTYDQQLNRRTVLSQLFQYAMGNGVCAINPFNNSDYAPRLFVKPVPEKQRAPLELEQFWTIYNSEAIQRFPHVRIAMGLALTTCMRAGDICRLKFNKHLEGNWLKTGIEKSINQRGATVGAYHEYDLDIHIGLKKLVNEARELSLKHRRCPFILSYHPKGSQMGEKEHISQVTRSKLTKDFAKVRDLVIDRSAWPKGKNPASFHEIKGLYILRATQFYDLAEVQQAAAHTKDSTTRAYPAQHEPNFTTINVVMSEDKIGGKL